MLRRFLCVVAILILCAGPLRAQKAPPGVLTVHAAVHLRGIAVLIDGGNTPRHHGVSLAVSGGIWSTHGEVEIVATDYQRGPTWQHATILGLLRGQWVFLDIALTGKRQHLEVWVGARVLVGDVTGTITLRAP